MTRLLVGLVLVVGCSPASTEPVPAAPLVILGRPGMLDTVEARPSQGLVVKIQTTAGNGRPGVAVRFSGVPAPEGSPPGMLVRTVGASYTDTVIVTTDTRGQALVEIQFGRTAGPAGIALQVPELGLVDTVRFTVQPGAATRVVAAPRDTAIRTGLAFQVRAAALDRFGNPRGDAVTFSASATPLNSSAVSQIGVLTPSEPGQVVILAAAGPYRDTLQVIVVPDGEFLSVDTWDNSVRLAFLDGRDDRIVVPGGRLPPEADWSRDRSLVVVAPLDVGTGLDIHPVAGGARRLIRWPTNTLAAAYYPSFSPDARWIYFTGQTLADSFQIHRVRDDGTGLERLSDCECYRPSVSPDGSRLVLQQSLPQLEVVRVFDIGTRAFVGPATPGLRPEWSPTGDRIAFVDAFIGRLQVMNADGTNIRILTPVDRRHIESQLAWSPDGRWILARRLDDLDLVDVDSGLTLTLPWARFRRIYPVWR